MRLGIIDLGTNSVRFDVHQFQGSGRSKLLHREKLMVRLGQGVFSVGKLDPHAVRRTISAFTSFAATMKQLRIDRTVAFATSALREARDREALLSTLQTKTGIEVRVISGSEEARLIALGVLKSEKRLPRGNFGLIDIGGGSTEICICRGRELRFSESFPLGTARLQQIFLKQSPPRPSPKSLLEPTEHLRNHIRSTLLRKATMEEWPKTPELIGSSGTIRALAKLLKKKCGGTRIQLSELSKLTKLMTPMTTGELLSLPGMESKRVDMILAGAILLEESMKALGAKKLVTTELALRDGILEEERTTLRSHQPSSFALHLDEIRERTKKFYLTSSGGDHPLHVEKLALQLYDGLTRLHDLPRDLRPLLQAAALFHDLGEHISPVDHEEHSAYIVLHADLPGLHAEDREWISKLCLLHRKPRLQDRDLAWIDDREERRSFQKLLAILQVADALDRSHQGKLRIQKLRQTLDKVVLRVTRIRDHELERLRLEQKKVLFEEIFQKKLILL